MNTQMINRLQDKREGIVKTLAATVDRAEAEGRDLTDDEVAERTAAKADVDGIDSRIASLADSLAQNTEIAEKVRKIGAPDTEFSYRNAGEALYDLLHQGDPDSKARYSMSLRAAEHMGTLAANTTPTAGDLGGLVIAPSVGAIVDPFPGGMPFLNWLGWSRIPSAAFSRPHIIDPDFEAGVAEQTKEKAELVSKKFSVGSTTLSPVTYGGYLNVSQQLITLQPGALSIIIRHLRKRLAWALESAAITEIGKTTGAVTIAATGTAADYQAAIYDASAKVITSTQEPATFLLMGPLGYAKLGALVDLAGRPMFPYLGASNADGTSTANAFTSNVFGLRAVVTPAIKDDAIYVGNGAGIEAWYYPLPLLEAVEPSVLGRQVAVSAMLAPFRPTGVEDSIVKLTPHA